MRFSPCVGSVVVALSLLAPACKPKPAAPLRVAAAADLARAFDELRPAFAAQSPAVVTVTLGSTGLLARQIMEGAPFDLFLAANSSYVAEVVKSGACDGTTRTLYGRGQLVLWVKGAGGAALTLASLSDTRFKHIAIANPEHAPYGVAAREALTHARIWGQLAERLVYGENVQQTLQLAQSGNADVAIVGLSLALGAPGGSWSMVDEASYAPLDQALVVCKRGANRAGGHQLADFLSGPAGRAILRKYGFLLPGEALARAP